MEERQTHEHLLPLSGLFALFELDLILSTERPEQIVFQTTWRFVGHFDSLHEDCNGEDV